jgi:superfamily I DNA and/or RNA helicase
MVMRFGLEELLRYNKDNLVLEHIDTAEEDDKRRKQEDSNLFTLIERAKKIFDPIGQIEEDIERDAVKKN